MKRKILSVLLVAVMLLGMMPFSAFAGELPANEPTECMPVPFAGQGGTVETTNEYTPIDENCCLWQNGNYVVTGNVTLNGSASVVGTVNLILCDGAKLTVTGCNEGEAAIYVPEGSTLNIYGQKCSSGKLTVAGGDFAAGIGGCDNESFPTFSNNCGNINIYGGVINAVGGYGAAGIGGGWGGSAGNVVIYGGTVTAEGDECFGAGIGAGEEGNCAGTVTFEGGNTHVSGAWAVRCKATVSDDLCVYDFDIDQYTADGWRLGYAGNPSVDALIGSCSFIENGEIKSFPTHFRIYEGQTNFDTGFYYVMQDYTFDSVLTVTGESQFVLADGVTVDARIGKRTGNNLKVFTQSTGEAQGRALGLTAYNEKGKLVTVPEFSQYGGEASLSAGTYYVTGSFELDGSLTVSGKVNLILADGVTLELDKLILETGATLTTYTESLSDNKGKIDGYVMSSLKYISADGTFVEMPQDYKFYNGETTLESGWYFVSDKGCDERVTVSGTVHLVLGDGADVLFAKGMTVLSGNTLCIYAQSTGDRMGSAKFRSLAGAGIGTVYSGTCGTVVINGGNISANGDTDAAGIGGGDGCDGGNITVNGGIVTATGGSRGAGIGGGAGDTRAQSQAKKLTTGGSLTVNGGFVKAYGSSTSAAIGGGYYGLGSAVKINGGTVWAFTSRSTDVIGNGNLDGVSQSDIQNGSFSMCEEMVAYTTPSPGYWLVGPSDNLNFFHYKTSAFIFDGHYYDAEGTRQMMTDFTIAYNGETSLRKNSTYYVRESCTINEPIFVPEGVTLILDDGVEMNAAKGLLVTGDSEPKILTKSLGTDKGSFTGEIYYCYNNEGEGGKFPTGLYTYNGEARLTQGYLVTEDVTAGEPILLDGNVSLFLYDGVTFNAAKGYLMTAGSTLTVYTLSQGENKGVFIGEKLTKACEKTLPEYVKLYTGQTSPSAGWYYVRENCTLDEAMILRNDVHFIIPDGVTLDVPKGIYLTESAEIDICPLSEGENSGQITARIFSEYIDAGGSHSIPDNIAVYSKGTTTLNGSYYLVLENSSVDVFSFPNENVTLLIADGVTLKGNAGYFGYEPNVGTFSTGENAGRFVGGALSYLDENGNICLLASDAHMYNGENVLTDGIWFVGSSKTETGRITVSGDVLLVLGDSTTLKAYRGITVAEGNTLTVTSQSEGENRGKLLAYTFFYGDHEDVDDCDYSAAIGGNEDPDKTMGTVIIRHGYVEAHGFSGGAGIGCEYADIGGTVIISGGTVVAYGNEDGIGIGGDGTTVTVLGGEVFSYGDETGGTCGGSGFGGENSVLNVLGGKVYACGKHGDCAVLDASVTLGEKMRAADLKTNKIYEDTLFTGSVQSGAKEVLFFDASAVDEKGETVLFPATGRIYNGETVLEKNTWYYVTESAAAEDLLIFREGVCMVLADGVTLESAKGILCPASGVPAVYSTSNGENKGKLAGTLLLPYVDSEGEAHALPDDVSLYNGQTELDNEWVYVDENYTLTAPLTVRGNVSIVLADGVTLDAAKGVVIEENAQLNILYVSNGKDKGVFIGTEKGYIDENGTKKNMPEGFAVYNGETVLTDSWYFVTADTVLDNSLEISGDVMLVLADGVTLTANKGILLTEGNSLTVYAQSKGENVGSIIAYGDKGAAGIGGDFSLSDAGSFTVNGINITAVGGVGAAGIGGGLGGNGGTVVINNGTLTATGGSGAKAIGGGTGAADDGALTINESLAVEAGNGAQSIAAFEYDVQSFVKVTNHGEKYLCGIVGVSDGTAENITVILTDTENSANVYNGATDGTNVYYVDNAANGTYIMSVACVGAVTRTYNVEITDGRVVKSAELYIEGDVNGDGKIGIYDYQQAVNIALSNENAVPEEGDLSDEADYEIAVADFDCDGYVDVLDVMLVERKVYA